MDYIKIDPEKIEEPKPNKGGKKMMWVLIGAGVLVVGLIVWLVIALGGDSDAKGEAEKDAQLKQQQEQIDALNEKIEMDSLRHEYETLENEFSQLENRKIQIQNDSIKQELTDKYNAARQRVADLLKQLESEKKKSTDEINKLKAEIETLKGILRHYVEEIDRLSKENEELRTENTQLNADLKQRNSELTQVKGEREHLQQRMDLAEKLNVTGVTLQALNSKGKNEKKVEKAKQLMVTFTIPQNNSTPVGEKTIYLRIVSPSGDLLGNGGSFAFEGGSVACTARRTVEYSGQEIAGVTIYWDVNTVLTPGEYTVELFTDGYRLTSRRITLK